MADTTLRGSQLLVKVGGLNPGDPYTKYCLINTERGIEFGAETARGTDPRCDDEDLPTHQWTEVDGLTARITGSGTIILEDVPFFEAWRISGESRYVQVWLADVQRWQGAYKLTAWSITSPGPKKGKVQTSITLDNDGEVVHASV